VNLRPGRETARENGGHSVIEAFPVVENESAPEHQSPDVVRDRLYHLADNRAAVAVSDQDDVGQTEADNEIDNRLARLRVADVLVDAFAVACHGGPEGPVAVAV
jgi:hypothetical protein